MAAAARGQIQAASLVKTFHGIDGQTEVVALADLALTIAPNEFVALLGPSGCGKSTFLNLVAGFERPTHGTLLLDGRVIEGPGPDRGMVFQEPALFPWLTVFDNVAFGLRNRGAPKSEVRATVERYLGLVDLAGAERRYPRELSGGMRQRVALAQVLANEPEVLLMDEPFGALDAITRYDLQRELRRVWRQAPRTVVFVTHSVDEALYLADRVVVMSPRPGRVLDVLSVGLPHPRDLAADTFNALRREALGLLERGRSKKRLDRGPAPAALGAS